MTRLEKAIQRVQELTPKVRAKMEILSDPKFPKNIIEASENEVNQAAMMEDIIRQRFSRDESKGENWKPLKPATVKQKQKAGENTATLERTGALKAGAIRGVAGTFRMTEPIKWDLARVGVRYAKMVNKKRHFYDPPNEEELRPSMQLVNQIITLRLDKLMA